MALHEELLDRCSVLKTATFQDVTVRLLSILEWMESQDGMKVMLEQLRNDERVREIVQNSRVGTPPLATNSREIAGVGLYLLDSCMKQRSILSRVALNMGIYRPGLSIRPDTSSNAAMQFYVSPFFEYVLAQLPRKLSASAETRANEPFIPVAIQESLADFRKDFPDTKTTCFIMMQFSGTQSHEAIERVIKGTLLKYDITGLLARDRQYSDDLYPNIQTYMHGCKFGIAVFERIEADDFNPNVSLEVGYMLGLKKGVLLLKERTLSSLHTDLVGKLYREFDVQNVAATIPQAIEPWMEDRGLI